MPAGGSQWGEHFDQLSLGGIYWSSTLYSNNPDIAYGLYFESNEAGWEDYRRDIGRLVRPVLSYHY